MAEWQSQQVGGFRILDVFVPPGGSLDALRLPSTADAAQVAVLRCDDRSQIHWTVVVPLADVSEPTLPSGLDGLVHPGWPEEWGERLRLSEAQVGLLRTRLEWRSLTALLNQGGRGRRNPDDVAVDSLWDELEAVDPPQFGPRWGEAIARAQERSSSGGLG